MSKDERIKKLECERKDFNNALVQQRFKIKEQDAQIQRLAGIILNVQPLLARMISCITVLQNKGIIDESELTEVTEKAQSAFITSANPEFAKEVRGEPTKGRVMAGNFRDSRGRIPGDAGIGGASTSYTVAKDREQPGPSGLPDVRAAHDSSDGAVDFGAIEEKNILARSEQQGGDGDTGGIRRGGW